MPPVLRIAVDTPLRRLFDYLPPPAVALERLVPGIRVRVPFGRRRIVAVLVEVSATSEVPPEKLRSIIEAIDEQPVIEGALLEIARWTADYYQHPIGEVLAAMLPTALREGAPLTRPVDAWQLTAKGRDAIVTLGTRAPRQREMVELLAAHDPVAGDRLSTLGPRWRDTLRALRAREWVEHVELPQQVSAWGAQTAEPGPTLTPAQSGVLEVLCRHLDEFGVWLLQGVTGSGKTEVYLRAVEKVLAAGRQVLVLVPEITLTPQLVGRFERRFAAPLVALHSGLGDAERAAAWRRARSGDAAIVIGTRSAVFVPLARPGLLVVDEEHDASYKQQDGFRYSARDLAIVRGQRVRVPVVLGSATPSLESLENARQGRYRHVHLPERPGAARHPRMMLVDLRRETVESGLAGSTLQSIERHLAEHGQVLVYLNRRGYAPTLFCPGCGWVAPCRNCDARLTVHLGTRRLKCHHCGADERLPLGCPRCGHEVKPVGQGTERVEDSLRERFPRAALVRFDRDKVRHRDELVSMLDRVAAGEARILVGTQMLTKGHDFPDVTLVVVVHADQGLFSADFRASERLAQTIVQVAGRAGRASRPGEVIIQTEFPEHPLLVSLLAEGYEGFAAAALEERSRAGWPPFTRLALLRADAPEEGAAMRFLEAARTVAEPLPKDVRVLGPVPAAMSRRAGRHHAQLLAESASRTQLHRFLSAWIRQIEERRAEANVHWSVDVDPIEVY